MHKTLFGHNIKKYFFFLNILRYVVFVFFILAGCAEFRPMQANSVPEEPALKIRYVNLNVIFDYMVKNDEKAAGIKSRKEILLAGLTNDGTQNELTEKMRGEYSALLKEEENHKEKILNRIDKALSDIAEKMKIDYVLNLGEGAIFARKEYDITEDVIRELMNRELLRDPVSR